MIIAISRKAMKYHVNSYLSHVTYAFLKKITGINYSIFSFLVVSSFQITQIWPGYFCISQWTTWKSNKLKDVTPSVALSVTTLFPYLKNAIL